MVEQIPRELWLILGTFCNLVYSNNKPFIVRGLALWYQISRVGWCTTYLLVSIPNNSLKQQTCIISYNFWEKRTQEKLSWAALAQNLSGDGSQAVGWGCSILKAAWGLENVLLSRFTRVTVGRTSQFPTMRASSRAACVFSWHGSWLRPGLVIQE